MFNEETKSPMTFRDARDIVVRRRWLIGGGLFTVWLLIWTGSWLLPSVYSSESVILVEQQKVSEDLVAANMTSDLQQRLESMRQQILSRTRLQSIIDEYQLYGGGDRKSPDTVIEQMRKDIKTDLVETPGRHGQYSAFKISYRAPSAKLAQTVNAQLTSLFIDQNISEQTERSENTTEFLSSELQEAREHLAQQEAKVKQFKMGNLGRLPSQVDSNVHILSGLLERQHNLSESLNRAQEQKLYLESLLTQQRAATKEAAPAGGSLASTEEELAKLKQELQDDRTKYTPQHPDILRLQRQIARAEKQVADMKAAPASETPDPVLTPGGAVSPLAQVESQLKANQQEVENTRRELANLDAQISGYQSRLNETPVTEQQLADLTRDYDQSKSNYDSLLKKQMQSQISTNLVKRQQGEQFRIIDQASLPTKPVSPDRFKLSLLGVIAGLVTGIGLAALVEAMDDHVRKEEEITSIVKVRILAGVPHLSNDEEDRKTRWRNVLEWGCACLMLAVVLGGNVFMLFRG